MILKIENKNKNED